MESDSRFGWGSHRWAKFAAPEDAAVRIDPASWDPPKAPAPVGVYAPNQELATARVLAKECVGAESVTFDSSGRVFTGLHDGRILRIDATADTVEVVATAGIPLGMQFDRDGRLVVADAELGLTVVGPADGAVTVLADHVNGEPIMFADDLAIAESGLVSPASQSGAAVFVRRSPVPSGAARPDRCSGLGTGPTVDG